LPKNANRIFVSSILNQQNEELRTIQLNLLTEQQRDLQS